MSSSIGINNLPVGVLRQGIFPAEVSAKNLDFDNLRLAKVSRNSSAPSVEKYLFSGGADSVVALLIVYIVCVNILLTLII